MWIDQQTEPFQKIFPILSASILMSSHPKSLGSVKNPFHGLGIGQNSKKIPILLLHTDTLSQNVRCTNIS